MVLRFDGSVTISEAQVYLGGKEKRHFVCSVPNAREMAGMHRGRDRIVICILLESSGNSLPHLRTRDRVDG